jgi:hypothetical protein
MLALNEVTTRSFMRQNLSAVLLLAVAGCATSASQSPPVPHQVPVDAKNVVDVQRAGYKIVNRDGQTLYCRRDVATGTHINNQTTCLTEQQLAEQMSDSQQGLERVQQQSSQLHRGN